MATRAAAFRISAARSSSSSRGSRRPSNHWFGTCRGRLRFERAPSSNSCSCTSLAIERCATPRFASAERQARLATFSMCAASLTCALKTATSLNTRVRSMSCWVKVSIRSWNCWPVIASTGAWSGA
jgi:hypothetical protein